MSKFVIIKPLVITQEYQEYTIVIILFARILYMSRLSTDTLHTLVTIIGPLILIGKGP